MTRKVKIETIEIEGRLLKRKSKTIDALKESIGKRGLIEPPIVRRIGKNRYRLIAGRHRVEACRQLGWTEIPVVIEAGRGSEAWDDLAQIDENLIRFVPTKVERATLFAHRKKVYEAAHPQAPKRGGARRGKKVQSDAASSANKNTAEKTGVSTRTVQKDVRRVEVLGTENVEKLQGTSLGKGRELDALMALPEAERAVLIDKAIAGEQVSATNVVQLRRPPDRLAALIAAWDAAADDERNKFCVLKGLEQAGLNETGTP